MGAAYSWRSTLPYLLVLAVGLVVLLPKLGDFGFWDPWEPKYAQSVREMHQRDTLVVPYYRNEARLAKPILAYWSVMLGTFVAGDGEFGARIGGVCSALIGALALCYAVIRVRNPRAGMLAGIALITMPQFAALARQATTDVYLLVGLGLSLLFLALASHTRERRRRHLCVSYFCLAGGILAKGPVVSGTIFAATVAILLVLRIDWDYLWSTAVRKISAAFGMFSAAVGALFILLAAIGLLFATTPDHWGWDTELHARLLSTRESLFAAVKSFHLALVLLIGAVVGTILIVVRWQNTLRAEGKPFAVALWFWAGSVIAVAGWALTLDGYPAVTAVCSVTMLALIGLYAWISVRVVHKLELTERLRPIAGMLGTQALWLTGIVALVAGPWFVAIMIKKSQLFVNDFLVYNHVSRAMETINKSAGADFYWRTMLFALFPWSCLIPAVLGGLYYSARSRRAWKTGFESCLMLSCMLILASFGSSVTKFSHYIAPMLIPFAALIGITLDRLVRTRSTLAQRFAWLAALALYVPLATDLLAVKGARYIYRAFTVKSYVPAELSPNPTIVTLVVLIGIAFAAALVWNSKASGAILALPSIAFAFYLACVFTPAISKHKTMKNLCESWETAAPNARIIGFAGQIKHSVFYYCGLHVVELKSGNIPEFLDPSRSRYAIVYKKMFNAVSKEFEASHPGHALRVIDHSHFAYLLVSNQPAGEKLAN